MLKDEIKKNYLIKKTKRTHNASHGHYQIQ